MDTTPVPYDLDVAPDGERWRYRKRWRQGLRRFLPSLWYVTDEAGLQALTAKAGDGRETRSADLRRLD